MLAKTLYLVKLQFSNSLSPGLNPRPLRTAGECVTTAPPKCPQVLSALSFTMINDTSLPPSHISSPCQFLSSHPVCVSVCFRMCICVYACEHACVPACVHA